MSNLPTGFWYVPDFLALDEEREIIRQLETFAYQHPVLRGQQLKRGLVQFGQSYEAARRRCVPAPPFPDDIAALIEKLVLYCSPRRALTQCIVTKYPPGAGIGWHSDAPCLGESIVAVSLGAAATVLFRRCGAEEVSHAVVVAPRSLYLMRGASWWEYQHRILPVKALRFSLTFRSVRDQMA